MISAVIFVGLQAATLLSPEPWGLDFAPAPRIPLVGDVNHDGLSDMVAVSPTGKCSIDVSLDMGGYKAGRPFQAISDWGENCQAAAIGEFDDVPGADVAGIFKGQEMRLAGGFHDGKFKDTPNWVRLPGTVDSPALASLSGGASLLAFSTRSGHGYLVDTRSRTSKPVDVPAGTVWIGDEGDRLVGQDRSGGIYWIDRTRFGRLGALGRESPGSRPAVAPGMVAFDGHLWTPAGVIGLGPSSLPDAPAIREAGQFEPGGAEGLLEFRYGKEPHTANQILIRRPAADKAFHCSSGDGLPDGWKLNGYRGLDFKGLGCVPGHADIVCLVSQFKEINRPAFDQGMARVVKFYAGLPVKNPDGTTGIHFHPVILPPISGDDEKTSWQTNRDKFLPDKWRGVVHWMQVTPGGGGQADELSDGGTCGEGALWAVFVHEFGHQLGLNHEGFWPEGASPIYTSLMNYTYSYSFEDDRNKIHYSDGSLSGLVLKETDLDETLPFPYEKVKFLEKGPYHYRLKPNGATTLIDWNWNGVFGEKHVRANINYAYSIQAGPRDDLGKTKTAPWLFVHQNHAFALLGTNDLPADPKTDPTLGPGRPGSLLVRRMDGPGKWAKPVVIESGGLIGDPVGISMGRTFVLAYQTAAGVVLRSVEWERLPKMSPPILVDPDPKLVPTIGRYEGSTILFLWNPDTNEVKYARVDDRPGIGAEQTLPFKSTNPVGLCEDTHTGEAILATAENQDKDRPNRWQIRRMTMAAGKLMPKSMEWVEGEKGGARGPLRLTPLFDASADAGPNGRVYLFGHGGMSKENPWACGYVAMQVADKSVHGGWLVKRYYDEWSQTRSATAAVWFNKDILYAYRWVDGGQGDSDNIFHLGYHGLGIDDLPMGDFDDLSYIRNFGITNSILYMVQ